MIGALFDSPDGDRAGLFVTINNAAARGKQPRPSGAAGEDSPTTIWNVRNCEWSRPVYETLEPLWRSSYVHTHMHIRTDSTRVVQRDISVYIIRSYIVDIV